MHIGALSQAIDELLSADTDTLDDAALHDLTIALHRETARFEALKAKVTGAWDGRGCWSADGSKAAAARLARDAHVSLPCARRQVGRARALRTMPATAAALAAGAISADHVDALARVNLPRVADTFAEHEEFLVGEATNQRDFDIFEKQLRRWIERADPDGPDRSKRAERDRFFDASTTFWGILDLKGKLDPINGTIVLNELQRLEQQLFEQDWSHAREEFGPDATVSQLARTAAHRRADALVMMAKRSAGARPGRATRPLLTILCGEDQLRRMLLETEDGIVLNPRQVIPLLAIADIERIVFGTRNRIFDVGVRERFFTGALRRALEVRDGTCTFPGCDTPARLCQADHVIPYAVGGETILDNGRLLCSVHNGQRNNPGPTQRPDAA